MADTSAVPSSTSAALAAILQQRALNYATPLTMPYIQNDAYLNDALQQMRQHGGENLRTSGALGANLLATALDQFGARHANQQLAQQTQSDQSAYDARLRGMALQMGALGQPGASPQPGAAPASGASGDAAPGGASAALPPGATPAPIQTATPSVTPIGDASSLTAAGGGQSAPMVAGPSVAPGTDPGHLALAQSLQLAKGGTQGGAALPRGIRDNNPLDISATQPWQGMVGNDGQYAQFDTPADGWRAADINLANYGKLHGINTLEGVAQRWAPAGDGNNNPDAYAASVAQGLGIKPTDQINLADPNMRHAILSGMSKVETGEPLQFGQNFSQSTAPGFNQSTASASQSPPTPRPVQLGNGPDPSIADRGAQGPTGASPFPVNPNPGNASSQTPGNSAPPPQGGGAAMSGPPTGMGATPQEQQLLGFYLNSPNQQLRAQGEQLLQSIMQRHSTPLTPPEKMMWGPNGQAIPIPGTQTTQLPGASPADAAQRDAFGNVTHSTIPGVQGPLPEGTAMVNGQIVRIQGGGPRPLTDPSERAQWGILPSDRNSYAIGADGKPFKTADNPYGPTQIQSVHDNFWNSDETKKAQEGYSAFQGLSNVLGNMAGKNNGVLDTAAVDSYLRGINPGMGARNTTVQMFLEHLGLPAEIQSKIQSITGNGYLTPQTLQQMVQVTHDYAMAHQQAAQSRAQADAKMVAPYGYGAGDLAEDLPSLGSVPTLNFGAGGVQPPNATPQPSPGGFGGLLPGASAGGVNPPHGGGAQSGPTRADYEAEARRRGLIK